MRVVGYTRVSTREQAEEGLSLGTQRAAIEAYCEAKGWELTEVIEDDGYTGRNGDRPGLQRAMTTLSRRNRPDAIVVARLDRLTRSLKDLSTMIERAHRRRWGIVAIDFDLNTTTANGELVAHIIGAVARWESRMNGERVSIGMREAYRQARTEGTKPTFGFQSNTPPDTINRIVTARNSGHSFNAIARDLTGSGTPTPRNAKRWYPSTVQRIYNSATKGAAA